MCRNAANTNTEKRRFSQVLAVAAEVVYHTSSLAGYQAIIWREHPIINIKLAGKMSNMTIPFWDSPLLLWPVHKSGKTLLQLSSETATCPAALSDIFSVITQTIE